MLAFKNANLIDGSGRPPVGGAAILIDGDKFAAVGPSAEIPSDAVIIDLRGKTVIPGLSDAHIHIGGSSGLDRPGMSGRKESYDFVEMRENCLRWGVLTVRTCGQFMDEALAFRDEVKAGTAAASPRVLVSSAMYQAPQGHPCYTVFGSEPKIEQNACVIVTDDLDIEASVQASAEAGADFIKTFYAHLNKMNYPHPVPRLSFEALRRIVDAAHSNGLKVAAHVDSPPELADALKCGVDFIEHLIGVGETETELTAALVEQARAAGTIIVPTMISILRFDPLGSAKPVWEPLKKAVKQLYDGGVRLAVGCDAGIPFVPFGEAVHDELSYLAEAGLPPLDILTMATAGNANLFGLEDQIGSIAAGKQADLLVLGSDPLADIKNTKDIRLVLMNGRVVHDSLLAK